MYYHNVYFRSHSDTLKKKQHLILHAGLHDKVKVSKMSDKASPEMYIGDRWHGSNCRSMEEYALALQFKIKDVKQLQKKFDDDSEARIREAYENEMIPNDVLSLIMAFAGNKIQVNLFLMTSHV